MSERLGIALIGAGRQGQAHLAACADATRVTLRAVCDVVDGAAAAVAPAGSRRIPTSPARWRAPTSPRS